MVHAVPPPVQRAVAQRAADPVALVLVPERREEGALAVARAANPLADVALAAQRRVLAGAVRRVVAPLAVVRPVGIARDAAAVAQPLAPLAVVLRGDEPRPRVDGRRRRAAVEPAVPPLARAHGAVGAAPLAAAVRLVVLPLALEDAAVARRGAVAHVAALLPPAPLPLAAVPLANVDAAALGAEGAAAVAQLGAVAVGRRLPGVSDRRRGVAPPPRLLDRRRRARARLRLRLAPAPRLLLSAVVAVPALALGREARGLLELEQTREPAQPQALRGERRAQHARGPAAG